MGGRARVRAGVVWVCLALGAGGIVVLWGSGTGTPGPRAELAISSTDATSEVAADAEPVAESGSGIDGTPPTAITRVQVEPSTPDSDGEPPPVAATLTQIELWIADLRDDEIRGNATAALRHLLEAGPWVAGALENALWSEDEQQRMYAAHALQRLRIPASDRMLRVLAEVLVAEPIGSREQALQWLIDAGPRSIPYLRPLLSADDYATRFHAAYALARVGDGLHAEAISQQMVRHLGHNGTSRDAMYAAQALYHIGRPAIPILEHARTYLDAQGRTLVDLILLDLRTPPQSKADFEQRRAMQQKNGISHVYCDPVIELSVLRSNLPRPRQPR